MVGLPGGTGALRQRLALAVLAGQQALRERRERSDADAVAFAGLNDLMLDVAVHHVVLRLDDRHRMQAAFRDDALGAFEPGRAPLLGDAVVQDLALVDQVAQRLQGLLHRRGRIEAVAVIQVDVIHAEILQAPLAVGQDVLAGQAMLVGTGAGREEHLAGDDHLVARILLEHAAEEDLGVAARIGVGAVEEVDAGLPRLTYDLRRVLHGGRVLQPGHPAAQRDLTDLNAGLADVAILHVWFLSHAGIRSARSSSSSQCPPRYLAIASITIVHRLPFFNPPSIEKTKHDTAGLPARVN